MKLITTSILTALLAFAMPIATQAKTTKRTLSAKHHTIGYARRGGRMPGSKTF